MATAPTSSQMDYARSLQGKIIGKMTYTFDRDTMLPAFLPDHDQELLNRGIAAKNEGRREDAKKIRQQEQEQRRAQAYEAMDAYLARRAELSRVDLTMLDGSEMSAWIEEAKKM